MNKFSLLIIIATTLVLLTGCRPKDSKEAKNPPPEQELVVYCENGVLNPVLEIAEHFKALYKIKVRIQNDCSQNLISLLQYTRDADIFIPDTYQAIIKLKNVHPTLFSDSIFLGYNPMVFLVAKGNPLNFNGQFSSLVERRLGMILANPETSSLGYETQQLLEELQLFDPIMRDNVVALSVDSRGLLKNVATGQASITIDWLSSYYLDDAHLLVDTISLPPSAPLPMIYAASLRESSNPMMARSFLEILNSEFGTKTFQKFGIQKRPSFVF